jgi:DNA-binding MarR family transcriptional regulator
VVGGDASVRFAAAVRSVADAMDGDLGDEWDSLTGLQVLFLKTIARAGSISRTDLVRDVRTSRAAIVPGLAVLLQKGFVVETPTAEGGVLTLGVEGEELLEHVDHVRAAWVRQALAQSGQDHRDDTLARAASLLEDIVPARSGDPS